MDDNNSFGAVGRRVGSDAVAPTFLRKDIYWGQRETPEYVTQHAVRARNFAENLETTRGLDEGENYFSWMEEPLDVSLIPGEPELDDSPKLHTVEEVPLDSEFFIEDDEYEAIMALDQVSDAPIPFDEDTTASLETLDELLATPGLELPSDAEDIGSLIGELAEIYEDSVEVDKVDFSQLEAIPEEVGDVVRIMSAEEFESLGLATTFTEVPFVEAEQTAGDPLQTAVSEIFTTIDETTWMEISQPSSIVEEQPPTSVSSSDCDSPREAKPKKKSGRRRSNLNVEARKERKREQNKEAAARYRNKRKETEAANLEILGALLKRNKELKQQAKKILSEVSSITRLARDVFRNETA